MDQQDMFSVTRIMAPNVTETFCIFLKFIFNAELKMWYDLMDLYLCDVLFG